ncbi:MAG TPA: hypothetical protein VFU02_14230 [Polyangiaceae bacterium]|nr:hypothetical protein [Polyangiaceae bacterium]
MNCYSALRECLEQACAERALFLLEHSPLPKSAHPHQTAHRTTYSPTSAAGSLLPNKSNGCTEITSNHVRVALGGGEVGVAGELFDNHRPGTAPAQLRDEEVPQRMHAPAFEAGPRLRPFERLQP